MEINLANSIANLQFSDGSTIEATIKEGKVSAELNRPFPIIASLPELIDFIEKYPQHAKHIKLSELP